MSRVPSQAVKRRSTTTSAKPHPQRPMPSRCLAAKRPGTKSPPWRLWPLRPRCLKPTTNVPSSHMPALDRLVALLMCAVTRWKFGPTPKSPTFCAWALPSFWVSPLKTCRSSGCMVPAPTAAAMATRPPTRPPCCPRRLPDPCACSGRAKKARLGTPKPRPPSSP